MSKSSSIKFKFVLIKCPFCEEPMSKYNIAEYNDKYIKCTNGYCKVVYIPRDKNIRKKLSEILKIKKTQEFVCHECSRADPPETYNCKDCSEQYITGCVNCSKDYVTDCVLHNNQYSVCPECNFKNPYCDRVRAEIDLSLNGENGELYMYKKNDPRKHFSRCATCKLYFINKSRSYFGDSSDDDEDACYYDFCGDCVGNEFSVEFRKGTAPFKLPSIDTYPKISLDSELHKLSLLYLPACK